MFSVLSFFLLRDYFLGSIKNTFVVNRKQFHYQQWVWERERMGKVIKGMNGDLENETNSRLVSALFKDICSDSF